MVGDKSAIEWTDATWNPVSGCTKVSTGCRFCYAERVSKRMRQDFSKVVLHPDRLDIPLHWRKPRKIFVCSMSDLFHKDVPDSFLHMVFAYIIESDCRELGHNFLILTKRVDRLLVYLESRPWPHVSALIRSQLSRTWGAGRLWFPGNIWLGVSCENQEQADRRIPLLLQTPAAVRFVSLEPLLGPIALKPEWLPCNMDITGRPVRAITWVIVGGESGGPPERALVEQECACGDYRGQHDGLGACRVCPGSAQPYPVCKRFRFFGWSPKLEAASWILSLRDQCQAAGVPFFFKQWGGPRPTSGGRVLDGRTWDEFPL